MHEFDAKRGRRTVFDAKRAIADGEHGAVRHHDRIGNGAAVENGLTAAAQILQDDLREWKGAGRGGAQMGAAGWQTVDFASTRPRRGRTIPCRHAPTQSGHKMKIEIGQGNEKENVEQCPCETSSIMECFGRQTSNVAAECNSKISTGAAYLIGLAHIETGVAL
jgi:hypothetical protein